MDAVAIAFEHVYNTRHEFHLLWGKRPVVAVDVKNIRQKLMSDSPWLI